MKRPLRMALVSALMLTSSGCGVVTTCLVLQHERYMERKLDRESKAEMKRAWDAENAKQ